MVVGRPSVRAVDSPTHETSGHDVEDDGEGVKCLDPRIQTGEENSGGGIDRAVCTTNDVSSADVDHEEHSRYNDNPPVETPKDPCSVNLNKEYIR